MKFLFLRTAKDAPLDLPVLSIISVEGMRRGKNPHFPEAKSAIWYDVGDGVRVLILNTPAEDIEAAIDALPEKRPRIKVKLPDTGWQLIPIDLIVAREGLAEPGAGGWPPEANCVLTVSKLGENSGVTRIAVCETRDEIAAMMDPPTSLEAPASPPARSARKGAK